MTDRKTHAVFRRVFALVVSVAVAALSWSAFLCARKKAYAESPTFDHASATAISEPVTEPTSGSYYLTDDIALTASIELFQGENVKLCLHGHSITAAGAPVFRVYSGCTLDIYDCGGTDNCGKIGGRGINIQGGTVNMYGGAIKNASGGYGVGGGMTVGNNGVFNMYGGEIADNEANGGGGGGVYIGYAGTFNMYGGTISNNRASKNYGGGVFVGDATATFHMYGGSIINNVITFNESESEDTVDFYGGAGVFVNGGTFTVEGGVNIGGNVKGKASSPKANNVELGFDSKIQITGAIEDGSLIGVTSAANAVITGGYTESGNTKDPSVFFSCDNPDYSIGYDKDLGKEAAVYDGSVVAGNYVMTAASVKNEAIAPKIGDESVSLNIEVTLENPDDHSTKTVQDVKTVACSPLQVGDNALSFDYEYKGVTKRLTYNVHLNKATASVSWSCAGATYIGPTASKRDYDGADAIGDITASYASYDGQTISVRGGSDDVIVKKNGAVVHSVTEVGEYVVSLAPSAVYEFYNNMFTLTVEEVSVEQGYYKMVSARAIGVKGTPTAGDTTVTVIVEVALKHTQNQDEKTETVNNTIALSSPLKGGNNSVKFDYEHKVGDGTVQVITDVLAIKKQVSIIWYYNDSLASGNSARRVYDGTDASAKIVAEYMGIDGKLLHINGAAMLKKDGDGLAVTSLTEVGVYTLSLAASTDYEFKNNLFTYTVAHDLGDIADLTYEEDRQVIIGITCDDGFETGTRLVVDRVDVQLDVGGKVSSAFNVSFVNNSVAVEPMGIVTVQALIPDELRGGKSYRIYNLRNGVAKEIEYTTDGNYAIFSSDELSTIVFVADENSVIHDQTGGIRIDTSVFIWLWVFLAILAVCSIVSTVVLITSKRKK